ncbi:MAG: hypothetical protein C0484_10595 [Rhodospirillum sp.]|nr:hypothetical protein [Rhodospirillum sp.]
MAAGLVGPVVADSGLSPEEPRRWDPPAQAVTVTDDPAAPYVAYFTPPYRAAGSDDLAWSMMATRWRETGDIRLSIGVRMLHGGQAWGITGWRLADPRFPPHRTAASSSQIQASIEPLKPLDTCTDSGCRTYEAASFALPPAALDQAALTPDGALEISILTQAGETHSIRFPAGILAELNRMLAAQRTSLITP